MTYSEAFFMLKLKLFKKIKEGPFLIPILCLLSLLCIAIGALIASFAVMATDDPLSSVGPASLITLIASAVISGFVSERVSGDTRACLIAFFAAGIILAIPGLIFGSLPSGILNGVCFFGSGALSCLLSKTLGSKRKHRR